VEVTARDLAKYRLELAEEKLDVAVKLLDDKAWRDAASRAYYAMFHAVRALLATKRLDSRKHSGVISLFNQHFVKPGLVSRDLGRILMTAKDFRERGDYDEFAPISEEMARTTVENASRLVEEIKGILADQWAVPAGEGDTTEDLPEQ
jgi:uncharacterized protein (UPF0332 family)